MVTKLRLHFIFCVFALLLFGVRASLGQVSLGLMFNQFNVVALTPNSTSAAAANTAVLNAQLAKGEAHVIGQSGTVYYFNGVGPNNPIVVGQTSPTGESSLRVDPGVTLKSAPGSNGPVMVSAAYTRPFNTLTGNGGITTWWHTATTTTTGTGSVKAMANTSHVTVGDTIAANTGSGGTGGPTATVVSIVANTSITLNASIATTSGQYIDITHPNGTPITWSSQNPLYAYLDTTGGVAPTTGQWVWLTGWVSTSDTTTAESAYDGVFGVLDGSSPTAVIIRLQRQPTSSPNVTYGAYKEKLADVHTSVNGGIYDYNSAHNAGSWYNAFNVILAGVYDLNVHHYKAQNQTDRALATAALDTANLDDLETGMQPTGSDGFHIYGPAFNVRINDVKGNAGDNIVAIQSQEYSFESGFDFPGLGGDLINVAGTNITCYNGAQAQIYPSNAAFVTRNVGFDYGTIEAGSSELAAQPSQVPTASFALTCAPADANTGSPVVDSVYFKHIRQRQSFPSSGTQQPEVLISCPDGVNPMTINKLVIEDVESATTNWNPYASIYFNGPLTMRYVLVDRCQFNFTGLSSPGYGCIINGASKIDLFNFRDNHVVSTSGGDIGLEVLTATNFNLLNTENNHFRFCSNAIVLGQSPTTTNVLRSFFEACAAGILANNAASIKIDGDQANGGMSNGFVRNGGSGNITILSGSTLPANLSPTNLFGRSGTGTFSFNGDCAGFKVDATQSYISASPGASVYNTNPAYNNFGQAGPIDWDANSVAHLRTNPQPATNFPRIRLASLLSGVSNTPNPAFTNGTTQLSSTDIIGFNTNTTMTDLRFLFGNGTFNNGSYYVPTGNAFTLKATLAASTSAYLPISWPSNTGQPMVTPPQSGQATTVTTGASSATQQVGSTANYAPGDVLHFATAGVNATIKSVTDDTHVVLWTSVSSTTGEAVTIVTYQGTGTTLGDGQWMWSQPMSLIFNPATKYRLRIFRSCSAGQLMPYTLAYASGANIQQTSDTLYGSTVNDGADYTMGPSTVTLGNPGTPGEVGGPLAIIGRQLVPVSVCDVYGDSIAWGYQSAYTSEGYIGRACANAGIAYYDSGIVGITAANLSSFEGIPQMLTRYSDYVLCQVLTNDTFAGTNTVTSVNNQQGYLLAMAQTATASGQQMYIATQPPRTTSTGNTWNNYAGQAVMPNESVRVALNNWERDTTSAGMVSYMAANLVSLGKVAGTIDATPAVEMNSDGSVLALTATTYTFTTASANATYLAVYQDGNGQQYTVGPTISSGLSLISTSAGTVSPAASGTLTKVSGTGDSTITYTAFTKSAANQQMFGTGGFWIINGTPDGVHPGTAACDLMAPLVNVAPLQVIPTTPFNIQSNVLSNNYAFAF